MSRIGKQPIPVPQGVKVNVAGGAVDVQGPKGKLKVPAGMMHNGDFDIDGVKLMPGSSITGFNLDAHDKQATVRMNFKAAASADEVRSYYVEQFKKQGVEAALAGDAVTGKTEDGSPFAIRVSPAASGSTGTIEIQDKD